MGKLNKKTNKKKDNKKVLTPEEVEKRNALKEFQKQQSLTDELKNIIKNLSNDINTEYKFNFFKKRKIKKMINKINDLIENKKYDEMEMLIKTFSEIDKNDKKDTVIKTKNFKEKFSIKNMRIPIFSRVKNILTNEVGKMKIIKLLLTFTFLLVMIGIFVIGLLMILNIIPFQIGSEQNLVFPAILIGLSTGVIFFI